MAGPGDVHVGSSSGARGPRRPRRRRGSGPHRRRRTVCPGSTHELVRARARPARPLASVKTSPRLASMTGTAPGAPAASASSVETPATRRPRARRRASSRSRGPCAGRCSSRARFRRRCRPMLARRDARVGEEPRRCPARIRTARERRSPRTSPSRTSAIVATSVAVSKARINMAESAISRDFSVLLTSMSLRVGSPRAATGRAAAARGRRSSARLGPLDEDDRVRRSSGSRSPQSASARLLEAVQVEVRDGHAAR